MTSISPQFNETNTQSQKIALLGSTGSIGTQVLDIVQQYPERFEVVVLTAGKNIQLLAEQVKGFSPESVCFQDESDCDEFKLLVPEFKGNIFCGDDGLSDVLTSTSYDTLIMGLVGAIGLKPTLVALEQGKKVLTANKETFVAGGHLVASYLSQIIPLDSEHSAIHQCLYKQDRREDNNKLKRLILTASGGPFRNKPLADFASITRADALKHPNWTMGQKITIDSATMMNKGLEVIEARWLFNVDYDRIEILVHPQSIVHGMIEFDDGAVLAQLGAPDMHTPLQYAMTYPERLKNHHAGSFLDFAALKQLDFDQPDLDKFPCIRLAYEAGKAGSVMTTVLNAANEVAVAKFLDDTIHFTEIPVLIEKTLDAAEKERFSSTPSLDEVLAIDAWARQTVTTIKPSVL